MDALSEALTSVRMTGAIFYHAECTAPWGFRVPHLQNVAHVLAPGTERLVSYHLVTDGKAVVCFPGEEDIAVTAGDILIIPHGDAHTVSNGSPSTFLDSGASLDKFLAGSLTTMRLGGGGETTRFVCGYFGCERHADRLFLAGLPLMIKINLRGDPAGEWLESSVRHLVSQA
jgi:Cupin